MTHDALQRWLEAYVDAWRTYDPAAIGALFAEDATYAYHPYDEGEEVLRGHEAIVADWLEEQDEPGTWEASYRPLVVEGRRAVAGLASKWAGRGERTAIEHATEHHGGRPGGRVARARSQPVCARQPVQGPGAIA